MGGLDTLSPEDCEALKRHLETGGRLVFYEYCISLVVITLRRPTGIHFLKADELGLIKGIPYSLISLLLGWWGIPMGLIYTPLTLITNMSGGCDVTAEVRDYLRNQLAGGGC